MSKGKTQKHYDRNPESRAVKAKYQKEFNKRPDQVAKRVELNKYNRTHGKKGDGKDASHKGGKIVGLEAQKTNRARKEKSRKTGSKRS
jgi:hypothetical protein